MKNLKKILMIVCCFCLTFLFAACNLQKDVNIVSIEVVETTVPATIEVGKFDQAGIQIRVNYADQTHETIGVTSTMLGDEYENYLYTPGTYTVTILFRGQSTELTIKIVPAEDIYTVNFYNGNNELISRQFIHEGDTAVAPSSINYSMSGYTFVGWDRTFSNITENINVYGIYSKIKDSTDTVDSHLEILFNSIDNMENYTFNVSSVSETESGLRDDTTYVYSNQLLLSTTKKLQGGDTTSYIKTSATLSEGNYIYSEEQYHEMENGSTQYHSFELNAESFGVHYLSYEFNYMIEEEYDIVNFETRYQENETVYMIELVFKDDNNMSRKIYFNENQILMMKDYGPETELSTDIILLNSFYYTLNPTTLVEFPEIDK